MMNLKKNRRKVEIDPDYNNRIYGYRMTDYKTLLELSTLYEQILNLKSRKAKTELINAIQKRALVLAKSTSKKLIKELFKNN